MTTGYTVTCSTVSKSFGDGSESRTVLTNVTGEIRSGEFLVLCGRSGVGKSTLLRLIAGLEHPTTGEVRIDDKVVDGPSKGLGYVVQDYTNSLFPWMSVKNNLRIALSSKKMTKANKTQAIHDALHSVGLAGFEKHYPWQLSGGMQQRVALARALVTEPRLLLMDEPFASVDAHIRLELEDLASRLVRDAGITTVFVTHDIDEAVYLADTIWVLAGNPATLVEEIGVPLGHDRNQRETRSLPQFLAVRDHLFSVLEPTQH
jgi:NitT/TauT family transport system ATP-binding protein